MRRAGRTTAVLLLLTLAGCRAATTHGQPHVVATIPPLGAILEEVIQGRMRVDVLLPPGASPHTYEPRPSDALAASTATAFFWIDPTLDGWATALPTPHPVRVLPLVPDSMLRPAYGTHVVAARPAAAPHRSAVDPHFWLDPSIVRALLPALVDTLAALDPPAADAYRRAGAAFARRLADLDGDVARLLAPVAGRRVVLLHASAQYMLARYGIVVVGVIEPAPGKEPSPRDLDALVRAARARGATAVLSEPQLPERLADLVARMAGIPLAQIDPLGGGPGLSDYPALILHDARVVRSALR